MRAKCVDVCPVGAISINDVVASLSPSACKMVYVNPYSCVCGVLLVSGPARLMPMSGGL